MEPNISNSPRSLNESVVRQLTKNLYTLPKTFSLQKDSRKATFRIDLPSAAHVMIHVMSRVCLFLSLWCDFQLDHEMTWHDKTDVRLASILHPSSIHISIVISPSCVGVWERYKCGSIVRPVSRLLLLFYVFSVWGI